MTKFSYLFYELDILDRNINFGWQSRGYPNPKRLLHSFSQLNYNLQPIEENMYMSLTKERKKENQAKRYSLNNSFLKYSQRIGEIMNE